MEGSQREEGRTNEKRGTAHVALKKNASDCADAQTHGHCDSMTELAQWGRISEKGEHRIKLCLDCQKIICVQEQCVNYSGHRYHNTLLFVCRGKLCALYQTVQSALGMMALPTAQCEKPLKKWYLEFAIHL